MKKILKYLFQPSWNRFDVLALVIGFAFLMKGHVLAWLVFSISAALLSVVVQKITTYRSRKHMRNQG